MEYQANSVEAVHGAVKEVVGTCLHAEGCEAWAGTAYTSLPNSTNLHGLLAIEHDWIIRLTSNS